MWQPAIAPVDSYVISYTGERGKVMSETLPTRRSVCPVLPLPRHLWSRKARDVLVAVNLRIDSWAEGWGWMGGCGGPGQGGGKGGLTHPHVLADE